MADGSVSSTSSGGESAEEKFSYRNSTKTMNNFLNLCAYFDTQPFTLSDVPLDGVGFRKLWRLIECFGSKTAVGYLWHPTNNDEISKKQKRLRLGDMDDLRSHFPNDQASIIGGVYCESMKGVSDFGFGHYPSSVWHSHVTPGSVDISASDAWVSLLNKDTLLEFLFDFWKILDAYKPEFGLVDYSPGIGNLEGRVFAGVTEYETPFQEWVVKSKWYQGGRKSGRVRSVYWGNYLSNAALERLGGADDFLSRFETASTTPNGTKTCIIWKFPNGVFVAVSPDPMLGFCQFGQSCINLDALIKELMSGGLL